MIHELYELLEVVAALGAGVVLRWLFLLIKPYRPCRWCRPGGFFGGSIVARLLDPGRERKRRAGCSRCRGARLTRRLGAKTAHRVKIVLTEAWQDREFWR